MNLRPMRRRLPPLFKWKVLRGGDPLAEPVPGEWYLGVSCSHCDEMVLVLADASRGQGRISFEVMAPEDEKLQRACVRGHLTEFRLDEMRRFQWRPRLNS